MIFVTIGLVIAFTNVGILWIAHKGLNCIELFLKYIFIQIYVSGDEGAAVLLPGFAIKW